MPSIVGGKKRSVKVNSDYPSTNNRLSHWYLSGLENLGANHVCTSQCEIFWIELELDEDAGFWSHAKAIFNHEFHSLNMSLHNLGLFLHPMCRKLANLQAAKGRSFDEVCKLALGIVKKWWWDQQWAHCWWMT
jgi:hypothetical protein